MLCLQALLNNARQPSCGCDSSGEQATPTGSLANPDSNHAPAATAPCVSTPAHPHPSTAGSADQADADSVAGQPFTGSVTDTANGRLNAGSSANTDAADDAGSKAAHLLNNAASRSTPICTGIGPDTAPQADYWHALLGLLHGLFSAFMAQLPKQVCKLMQPIGWYRLTHTANRSTGQTLAPQPWWHLDSWLTAPAEMQYQRYADCLHHCLGAGTVTFRTDFFRV